MEKIKLAKPSMEHKAQVLKLKTDFLENGEEFDGCAGLETCKTYEEWIDFDNRLKKQYGETYSRSDTFIAIRESDSKLIGIIDCRYDLTDFLLNFGGNIGYSIVIDERRKGYGKEMLRLALEKYREKGFSRVLITCDKENIASAKTTIANGGVLENEIVDTVGLSKSGIIQRRWIAL